MFLSMIWIVKKWFISTWSSYAVLLLSTCINDAMPGWLFVENKGQMF